MKTKRHRSDRTHTCIYASFPINWKSNYPPKPPYSNLCSSFHLIVQSLPNTMACYSTSQVSYFVSSLVLVVVVVSVLEGTSSNANFYQDFDITWGGNGRANILNNGQLLTLSLDRASGSGFRSKNQYLFGKIDMQIKLVPGNSAGTVTAYYWRSSDVWEWDEIDLEFLGNLSGQPYTLHTNIYTKGKGEREQQFRLWFDPTASFHTYSILWNSQRIIFYVDGTPIREFRNLESKGVPFPKEHPMRIHSSIWNADDWATQGGLVKTDWDKAPFKASYKNFNDRSACPSPSSCATWLSEELDLRSKRRLAWVRTHHMIYDYCRDAKRFPHGLPPECTLTN